MYQPQLATDQVKKESKPLKRIPTTAHRASTKRIKIIAQHNTAPPPIAPGATPTRPSAGPTTPGAPSPPTTANIRGEHATGTRPNERALQARMQEALIALLNKRLHAHGADRIKEVPARGAVRRRLAIAQAAGGALRAAGGVDAGGGAAGAAAADAGGRAKRRRPVLQRRRVGAGGQRRAGRRARRPRERGCRRLVRQPPQRRRRARPWPCQAALAPVREPRHVGRLRAVRDGVRVERGRQRRRADRAGFVELCEARARLGACFVFGDAHRVADAGAVERGPPARDEVRFWGGARGEWEVGEAGCH